MKKIYIQLLLIGSLCSSLSINFAKVIKTGNTYTKYDAKGNKEKECYTQSTYPSMTPPVCTSYENGKKLGSFIDPDGYAQLAKEYNEQERIKK